MRHRLAVGTLALAFGALGCDGGGHSEAAQADADRAIDSAPAPSDGGGTRDAAADSGRRLDGSTRLDEGPRADGDTPPPDASAPPDAGGDQGPDAELPALRLTPTLRAPADPLAGAPVESCAVYEQTRCLGGRSERCELYDPAAETFVEMPDPLLRRVLLYDRWYDLYGSPDGQAGERVFVRGMPGDTPESVWGAPESFARYAGAGDAAIWTGAALTAAIFRYVQTGTQADYERMEDTVRVLVRAFDVTGIPGYLARHHFLHLPEGAPRTDRHFTKRGDTLDAVRDLPIPDPQGVEGLPADYLEGIPDGQGGRVAGTPMWNGHPSIDQYTGPWTSFPLAYPLLRDEALKARMVEHLTCYLKRLRRLEIVNLQENEMLKQAFTSFLQEGGRLMSDPGDIDLENLTAIVGWYHAGLNPANADGFDRGCPDSMQLEPARVVDAASPTWLAQLVNLAQDLVVGQFEFPANFASRASRRA